MSVTWPDARVAIAAQLDGVTADAGAGFRTETLNATAFAPGGKQGADGWPYAFIIPVAATVERGANGFRRMRVAAVVRVMLAPIGTSNDMNAIQRRYDAWWLALTDALDDAVNLDGTADVADQQEFSGLALYDDLEAGWGFEMTLPAVLITEQKTFSG